jgi:hypothetical protein
MFEEYLNDADYFFNQAKASKSDEALAKRFFRASIFSSFSAIEAYINFIGVTFEIGKVFKPFEIALLTDKKFEFNGKEFELTEKLEFKRLEDKLKFILNKFIPEFNFEKEKCWSSFKEFKKLRDELTHPKKEEDELTITQYDVKVKKGFYEIIELMNKISKGIFRKPLRKKILELAP